MYQFKELLPLGSVVVLHGGEKKLMISGRLQRHKQSGQVYDYGAVYWPEGYLSSEEYYLFNDEDIARLLYVGMQNEEEFAFRHILARECEALNRPA